jgi:transcription elongation factor
MQRKLREMVTADIPIRATVAILDGPYRGLKGQIVGLDANNGFVRITLRSLDVVATIPRVFLEESVGE